MNPNHLPENEPPPITVLDALPLHIALLDRTGTVLTLNSAWRAFATDQPASSLIHRTAMGENYLAHCDAILTDEPRELARGIREVIAGDRETFTLELPVDAPPDQRWFSTRVTRVREDGKLRIMVAHEEITELKLARNQRDAREAELRHQLYLTEAITHKAADGLFLLDAEGRVKFLNAAAEEMLGWSREEIIGKVLHHVAHYRHPDGTPFPINECPIMSVLIHGDAVHEHEDIFFRKDGRMINVCCSNAPVTDGGEAASAVLIVRDIGDRKRAATILRDTEERYWLVARATSDVIWDWDLGTDEVLWNEAVGTVFGYDAEMPATDGAWWKERLHPDDHDRVLRGIYDVIDGEGHSWSDEYRFRASDGSYVTVFDRGYIHRNEHGQAIRMIGAMLDLTTRKHTEEVLRRAKEEAEAANQAKDQFIAVMSHELRTPLTPALASIQVLEDAELPADLRPFIEIIHRNIELEAQLIDDLLDFTRIARGTVELHHQIVDIHAIIRNVVDACHDDLLEKQILLWQNMGAVIHHVPGDAARLHQIFRNLLKNAIKFTPSGGTISIRTSDIRDGEVRVEVIDTGIGIAPAALPSIFDAFSQAEEQITRRFGGLGLGLAVTRAMVEMHKGHISAASQGSDKGATFTVELPTAIIPKETPAKSVVMKGTTEAERASILLVDDHPDTLKVISIILERRGMRVHTAMDMRGALDLASHHKFDLVVSDIGLPDGNGHDLIRELAMSGPIKAIAMSGFGLEEDVQNSLEAGFDEHLIKPVNIRKLEAAITKLLGRTIGGVRSERVA